VAGVLGGSLLLRHMPPLQALTGWRALLFLEKYIARGVFILCDGQAMLSIDSKKGKTVLLRVAQRGEALGLASAINGNPYGVTARILRTSQVAFVHRDALLQLMEKHPELYRKVITQITTAHDDLINQFLLFSGSTSVSEKLAGLLLNWNPESGESDSETRLVMPLTHADLAELLGTTRESVGRTFAKFIRQSLIERRASEITISNRSALERVVSKEKRSM